MQKKVEEINILEQLFSEKNIKYIIPLYQREFAWEDKEILQLIEDINDVEENTKNYYIGTLIVNKRENKYEVIDGQQRLTTLYLLFNVLEIQAKEIISFECREKSNYTLKNLNKEITEENKDRFENNIIARKRYIEKEIERRKKENRKFIEDFKIKLSKVKIYRIEVPENTNLNRYFEIMNTRGEQLEQQDIIKAYLMSGIINDKNRQVFATVWDACSDMNRYIQMNLNIKNRNQIFGKRWENTPTLQNIKIELNTDQKESKTISTINTIINMKEEEIKKYDIFKEKEETKRFESIINFSYFLLHALRIFVEEKGIEIKKENENKKLLNEILDDKKLEKDFKTVIEKGIMNEKQINKDKFAMEFIETLLKLRFLFDKYIIKREFINGDKNGEWSLKEVKKYNKTAYFNDTYVNNKKDFSHKKILMLQACLRVSYTSPKVMHWITNILKWLYEKDEKNDLINSFTEYKEKIEEIAKEGCRDFLIKGDYNKGVATPHIVFNYLDYLLWERQGGKENFTFEFRNSVEHWYPQNATEGTFEKWEHSEGLDSFGNLALMQIDNNATLSNIPPSAKNSYEDIINNGSLKLKIMAEQTKPKKGKNVDKYWKTKGYILHENEMIKILKKACIND